MRRKPTNTIAKDFTDGFIKDLQSDYAILKQVETLWQKVDPGLKTAYIFGCTLKKNRP